MSEVYNFVKDLLVKNLNIDEAKISMEAVITDDLGADSLDVMDLVGMIEKQYSITIPQEDYAKLKTVGDVVNYVASKQS